MTKLVKIFEDRLISNFT